MSVNRLRCNDGCNYNPGTCLRPPRRDEKEDQKSARLLPPKADIQFDIGEADDAIRHTTELAAIHGDIFRFYSPSRRADLWLINHPDDVKRVLVSNHKNYTKGLGLDRVKILLGHGIMTSEGELWKRQRYMMQPSFHRRVITEFSKLIDACNERFIAKWEAQAARGELVNITDDMSELTLEIVLLSIFGTDLERLEKDFGSNPFDIVTKETVRDLKFAYKFRQLAKLVGALAKRRQVEKTEHFDFLQMLIDARDKETGAAMSERELVDEAMTLIVAGHETTASALNWTWYLLSQNPRSRKAAARRNRCLLRRNRTQPVRHGIADVHEERGRRSAAAVPAGLDAVAPDHRAGRALGLRSAGRHRRAAVTLSTAPPPALLEGAGRVPARTLRCSARK